MKLKKKEWSSRKCAGKCLLKRRNVFPIFFSEAIYYSIDNPPLFAKYIVSIIKWKQKLNTPINFRSLFEFHSWSGDAKALIILSIELRKY